jgi:hypothetical protein
VLSSLSRMTRSYAPPTDIHSSGIVAAVVCGIIAAVSFLLLIATLFDLRSTHAAAGRMASSLQRTLSHQAAVLAVLALWLFATMIPVDVFVAKRSIGLTATLGGTPVPSAVVAELAGALGVALRYRKYDFRE